jgi:pentatricopeptide repeat protein
VAASRGCSHLIRWEKKILHQNFLYKKREKAEELSLHMINGGVHPDAVFFNTIMGNLCKEGRVTEAKHFFDLMVHLGATPYVFFV